jgi:polyisoprenyl-teichoic acid--peptidoglycan teichoic acid transferase
MQNNGKHSVRHTRPDARQENGNPKKRKTKKTALIITSVIAVLVVAAFGYIYFRMSVMNEKLDLGSNNFVLPTDEEAAPTSIPEIGSDDVNNINGKGDKTDSQLYSNPKIINILLMGLDTRDPAQFSGSRTDSLIIVSLDTANKEIKLTSIMRDTLVKIEGHDLNRINTVFPFSGPDKLVKTVQNYFGVKINYYSVVNFWAVANIIDSVGGVDITVNSNELSNLNRNLDEINKYSKDAAAAHVAKAGKQLLNGKQAVAYMRIRHVGEGDFERTERQRKVLESITGKNMSITDILKVVNDLPNNIRTDANQMNMVSLANTAFGLKGAPIKQLRIPIDGSYKMSRYKGMSILVVNFDKNADALKQFLINK